MRMNDDYSDLLSKRNFLKRFDFSGNALRMCLLFGGFAIALALFAAPYLDENGTRIARSLTTPQLDYTTTASVPSRNQTYVIRRSVLRPSPTAECMIRPNGVRVGAC